MRKFIVLGVVFAGLLVPQMAQAHLLSATTARARAAAACRAISNSNNNPYICRGRTQEQRLSAHAMRHRLVLDNVDPDDPETRCLARVTVRYVRNTRRVRTVLEAGSCNTFPRI